jgi:hypothetical protein
VRQKNQAHFFGAQEFFQGFAVLPCFRQLGQSLAGQLDRFPGKRGSWFVCSGFFLTEKIRAQYIRVGG